MRQRLRSALAALVTTLLGATVFSAQSAAPLAPRAPIWESCEEMHDNYSGRFDGLPGFGLARMPPLEMLDRSGILNLGGARYAIERIELVSLLKHNPPIAYVPRVHRETFDPKNFTSRALTDFERSSLAALRTGKDIASTADDKSGTLQCFGALRAKESCLTCHKDKKAGDVLGAFTYRLRSLK